MSKPRKLERFNPGYKELVMGNRSVTGGLEIRALRTIKYHGRTMFTKYFEFFPDKYPEHSIILN